MGEASFLSKNNQLEGEGFTDVEISLSVDNSDTENNEFN